MLRVTWLSLSLLPALAQAEPPSVDVQAPRPALRRTQPAQPPAEGVGRADGVLALMPLRLPMDPSWTPPLLQQGSETQRQRNVRRGAIAGGVSGGLLGVGLGFLHCIKVETNNGRPPFAPACALIGGAVGGLVGAGLGALVGLAIPESGMEWMPPRPGSPWRSGPHPTRGSGA